MVSRNQVGLVLPKPCTSFCLFIYLFYGSFQYFLRFLYLSVSEAAVVGGMADLSDISSFSRYYVKTSLYLSGFVKFVTV